MRRFVDLHTHSTFSDGTLAPAEIVRLAEKQHLAAVALTDHDTTAGLAAARAAAGEFGSLRFIPGVEISGNFPAGTPHILGLGIDEKSRALRELLDHLRQARSERNPKIIARLQQLGLEITMADVLAAAPGEQQTGSSKVVGRLHIARVLHSKGCVKSTAAAFNKYIGVDGPAYVDKECLTPRQAITAIVAAGGTAVFAHPVQLNCDNQARMERIIRQMLPMGLGGIEAYHNDHTPDMVRFYLQLARRYDLMVAGGSDFHGQSKPGVSLGRPRVPLAAVTASPAGRKLLGTG